jgi:hypothetical protein
MIRIDIIDQKGANTALLDIGLCWHQLDLIRGR